MRTNWGQRCTNKPARATHRDEQRESYEDAVELHRVRQTETHEEFFARLGRGGRRFHPHGADGGLGRPDARDAVDDDEGSW